ncbi:hypothetical protein [Paraburkholderia hayleyella]|uniref:hypothetical protein n=1 Tax=Paraburkholderia hayleyella TaxID=2152889 RepID=UPI001292B1DA|nr:hypothetical protein [Paraburkholderia hayleyella]
MILAFILIVLWGRAYANNESGCEKKLVISYANGIMNSLSNRTAGMNALKSMVGSSYGGSPVEYSLSDNPTEGFLKDLVRVLKQKLAEDPGLSWGSR